MKLNPETSLARFAQDVADALYCQNESTRPMRLASPWLVLETAFLGMSKTFEELVMAAVDWQPDGQRLLMVAVESLPGIGLLAAAVLSGSLDTVEVVGQTLS